MKVVEHTFNLTLAVIKTDHSLYLFERNRVTGLEAMHLVIQCCHDARVVLHHVNSHSNKRSHASKSILNQFTGNTGLCTKAFYLVVMTILDKIGWWKVTYVFNTCSINTVSNRTNHVCDVGSIIEPGKASYLCNISNKNFTWLFSTRIINLKAGSKVTERPTEDAMNVSTDKLHTIQNIPHQ